MRWVFILLALSVVRGDVPGTPPEESTQQPEVPDPCSDTTTPRPPTLVCPTSAGGAGVSGVIAASSFPSCTAFKGELDCGDVENVTVLDLGLNAGTGGSVSYDFSVVPASGSALDGVVNTGDCAADGGCGVNSGGKVRITVTSTPILLFYVLEDISLEVPYSYTSAHSNAYSRWDQDDNPDVCGAEIEGVTSSSTNIQYTNDRTVDDGQGGIVWSFTPNYLLPFRDTGNPSENCIDGVEYYDAGAGNPVPVEHQCKFAKTWPTATCIRNTYTSSHHNDCFNGEETKPDAVRNKYVAWVSDQDLQYGGSSDGYLRAVSDMVRPSVAAGVNYMDPSEEQNGMRRAYCMFFNTNGYNAAFDGDQSADRYSPLCDSNDTDDCRSDNDNDDTSDNDDSRCNNESSRDNFLNSLYEVDDAVQLPTGLNPHCRAEGDDDCNDGGPSNSAKHHGKLRSNWPCRQWYGDHFYFGPVSGPSLNPNNWQRASFGGGGGRSGSPPDTSELSEWGAIGVIRPVCIGCGAGPLAAGTNSVEAPYYGYGLSPLTPIISDNTANFDNSQRNWNNYYTPIRTMDTPSDAIGPAAGASKVHFESDDSPQYNECSADDDYCCQSYIYNEFLSEPAIPMAVCAPAIDQRPESVNPNCPAGIEPYVCPLCNKDRMGMRDTDLYYTASTMGKIGPMNNVFNIRPAPNPVFSVTAVMNSISSSGDVGAELARVEVTNVVLEDATNSGQSQTTASISGKNVVGQSGTDSKHIMFLEVVGLDTTTGNVGPELEGYIVIVNETFSVTGGSKQIYQGDVTKGGIDNPWVDSSGAPRIVNPFNNGLGGITPWPQFLNLDSEGGTCNTDGAWWYYVPAEKKSDYGYSCGKLGIKNAFFGDATNYGKICTSPRNTCVPGFIPGFDWTLLDRMNDTVHPESPNPGARERALRDSLDVHTPCVISGYFHEWMATSDTCSDFIEKVNAQGYLPRDWVLDSGTGAGTGACGTPQYWVFGNRLFYTNQNINGETTYIRLRLAVAGSLLDVTQQVSGGCFSKPDATANQVSECFSDSVVPTGNDVQCAVVQGEDTGSIIVSVLNTGGLTGDYIIFTNCSANSGITSVANPVFELNRNAPAKTVSVPIQHTGILPSDPTCTVRLSHPQFTFATFSELNDIPCLVVQQSGGTSTVGNFTYGDTCSQFGIGCNITGTPPPDDSEYLGVWLFLGLLFSFIFVLSCCVYCNHEYLNNAQRAYRAKKDAVAAEQALKQLE